MLVEKLLNICEVHIPKNCYKTDLPMYKWDFNTATTLVDLAPDGLEPIGASGIGVGVSRIVAPRWAGCPR